MAVFGSAATAKTAASSMRLEVRGGALATTPSGGNTVPPTITFISPTPGVAPGAVGGFPADPTAAKNTPIVIQVADAAPGVKYACVVIKYIDANNVQIEETVYRRGTFRGRYVAGSKAETVGSALQLTIKREGGWLELIKGPSKQIEFFADVLDSAGNLSA